MLCAMNECITQPLRQKAKCMTISHITKLLTLHIYACEKEAIKYISRVSPTELDIFQIKRIFNLNYLINLTRS